MYKEHNAPWGNYSIKMFGLHPLDALLSRACVVVFWDGSVIVGINPIHCFLAVGSETVLKGGLWVFCLVLYLYLQGLRGWQEFISFHMAISFSSLCSVHSLHVLFE